MKLIQLLPRYKHVCRHLQFVACVLALLVYPVEASLAQGADPDLAIKYTSTEFVLPPDVESMLSVDLNADTFPDLFAIHKDKLTIYLQQTNGTFDFNLPSATIEISGAGMGWDIASVHRPGTDQSTARIMALVDGRRILAWDFVGHAMSEPVVLLDTLPGFLPKGLFRLRFVRDINDDGLMDFVVPGAEQLHLYLQNAAGSYQSGIAVQSNQFDQTNLSSRAALQGRIGQSLTIPLMELRDLNNDGFNDLISRSDESIDVFYSQTSPASPTFAATPTYSIDLAALTEDMENFSLDQLDFSNLTAALAMTYNVLMNDVNNDGFDDVVIRQGGKISLFTSAATGVDFAQLQQVLRSSGNVIGAYIRDENDDGLADLWIARVETISIGDLFVWLALSGSLDIEVFIYRNEGSQFTRRPSRKLDVAVKYPSALSLFSTGLEFERSFSAAQETVVNPSVMANMNRNALDEMAVLMNDRLEVFFDMKEPPEQLVSTRQQMQEQAEQGILNFLGYTPVKDNYEIDIRDIMDEVMAKATASTDLLAGRTADLQLPLGKTTEAGDVFALDLNLDGIDDFVVFLDGDEEQINGLLLWSAKE